MSNLSNIPKQSNFETTLASPIDSSQTTGITLAAQPSYTPSGETVRITILNPKGIEHITATGWTGNVLSGVTRGVASYTGGSSTARAHGAGVKVIIGNPWQLYNDIATAINSKLDKSGGVATTPLTDATYASLAALQAAFPSPTNGMSAYCTAEGKVYDGIGGSWVARESGGTFANASETVAGRVEAATSAETAAGTDTGGTGALVFPAPSHIATNVQNNNYVYAATSTGNDDYAITVSPAIAAYAAGQRFIFKTDVANTGACTLNVSGKGAKDIKKYHDQALEDNDIEAGSIVEVVYDGANFQLQTPCATNMSAANIKDLTDGGATTLHSHAGISRANNYDTYNWSGGATRTITHNLGKKPTRVRVFLASSTGTSYGYYNSGSTVCYAAWGGAPNMGGGDTYIGAFIYSGTWYYITLGGLTTTEMTLTCSSNPSARTYITWEVEAD